MHNVDDTIVAIASAPGGSPRGVVRISGPQAVTITAAVFSASIDLTEIAKTDRVEGELRLSGPLGNVPAAAYVWPRDRSYTRQPTVELHTIGSQPILQPIVRSLCEHGARLAEPGEFTMRAFLAGRLDLTQAEAVLGVIDATSTRDLNVALTQLAGGLAAPLHQLREQLVNMLAHLEAGLDFVEEDIEFIQREELLNGIDEAATVVQSVREQMRLRAEIDGVPRVVLVGCPNAGKSSLLNALVSEDAAIVSEVSGTTRDYVERRTTFYGQPLVLVDTAGVEDLDRGATISSKAQDTTIQERGHATLTLLCLDSTRPLNAWESQQIEESSRSSQLIVATKTDRATFLDDLPDAIATSSLTGEGLARLKHTIYEALAGDECNTVTSTALRCHESLRLAGSSLSQARVAANEGLGEELVAGELRVVLEELGTVVGTVYTDDILDRIFSRFCIGK